jgi:hypothetical protein
MGRKRTSRIKKKRSRRLKGGSSAGGGVVVPDWEGDAPEGADRKSMKKKDLEWHVSPGGEKLQLQLFWLKIYFLEINKAIAGLKNEDYENDKTTNGTTSKELEVALNQALSGDRL